jgi:hypothetical protein
MTKKRVIKGTREMKDDVKRLSDSLWALRVFFYEKDLLSVNYIQWIDDSLEIVDVAYFNEHPHSDDYYKYNGRDKISYIEAVTELSVRIYNSLSAAGMIQNTNI